MGSHVRFGPPGGGGAGATADSALGLGLPLPSSRTVQVQVQVRLHVLACGPCTPWGAGGLLGIGGGR